MASKAALRLTKAHFFASAERERAPKTPRARLACSMVAMKANISKFGFDRYLRALPKKRRIKRNRHVKWKLGSRLL